MDDRESVRPAPPKPLTEAIAEARYFEELISTSVRGETGLEPRRIDGIVVGTVVGFIDNGATPLVTYRGQRHVAALPARTTVDLHGPHIGRDAMLLFEDGDPDRPIIVGCIRPPCVGPSSRQTRPVEVESDGERLVVSANHGLVLRCGKASITLSADGSIVLRGTHVVSHASGVNRIRGGSVEIN